MLCLKLPDICSISLCMLFSCITFQTLWNCWTSCPNSYRFNHDYKTINLFCYTWSWFNWIYFHDSYAIGGLSGGEDKNSFWRVVAQCTAALPEDKPRYVMVQMTFIISRYTLLKSSQICMNCRLFFLFLILWHRLQ